MNGMKIEDWLLRICGTAAMAVGFQCFLEPAHLVAGGVTGIGIMLSAFTTARYGFPTPLWLVNVALNFPLFLIAWKMRGGRFVGKTILTSLLFSLMLFVVQGVTFYSGDLILSSVYGGVFGGINGLYAILSVFISERCTKWVLEGGDIVRGAIVISDKAQEIGEALNLRLERDAAVFSGKGTLGEPRKEILFCIFSQKEIQGAKSIIMNIDRGAILLVTDIREVLGEGVMLK